MTVWNIFKRGGSRVIALLIVLVGLTGVAPVWAGDERAATGPSVGSKLSEVLTLRDHSGESRDFASLTGERGMILVFSRSLSWCPFCIADAREWSTVAGEARAKAVNIAIVTYDSVETLASFADRFGTDLTLLSDAGSEVIRALKILNEEHAPGSFAHGVPHPMVFVIDSGGTLRARFSETNYTHRPDKKEVMAAAFALDRD